MMMRSTRLRSVVLTTAALFHSSTSHAHALATPVVGGGGIASRATELHAPVGKDGAGDYTASTKGCFDVIDAATPAVLQAVEAAALGVPNTLQQLSNSQRAFVVADYGTADAGTSLGLMNKIVQQARALTSNPDLQVSIQYEDQKDNEWKSVFNHALGYKKVTDAYGNELVSPRTDEHSGVFVSACGVGFHSQAYPDNSVDVGVSFTAMHWLSRGPNSLRGKAPMHAAQCDNDNNVAEAERLQASKDWTSILMARRNELRPGGRMVIVNFCKSKEGYYLGKTDQGAVSMWDSFQSSWDRLAADGLIDEDERIGISFPSYYRTTQECRDGAEQIEGLKVIDCVERVVPCPYRQAYVEGNKAGRTPREHAEWYVPTTRTWSESTFKNALKDSRDKDAIMEQFWKNYEDLVALSPEQHGMDYVHTYLVIEKE